MNQVISAASTWRHSFLPDEETMEMQASASHFQLDPNRGKSLPTQKDFMMRITVDAASVSELRRVIVSTCGDLLIYMRVKPVDHATKMKFWLCLSKTSIDSVIGNILRTLPQAEFGRITPVLPT